MSPGREPFVVAKRRVSAQLERIPNASARQDHHLKRVGDLWHQRPDRCEDTTRRVVKHLKNPPTHQKAMLWRRLAAMEPTQAEKGVARNERIPQL